MKIGLMLLVLLLSLGAGSCSDSEPDDPLQGARLAILRLGSATSIEQLPEMLTNRTAAGVAMSMLISADLITSAPAPPQPSASPAMPELPELPPDKAAEMKRDLDRIRGRYSISRDFISDGNARKSSEPAVERQGRNLMADMINLFNRYSPGGEQAPKPPPVPSPDAFSYQKVDFTTVRITSKDTRPISAFKLASVEARFEDGRWRIDAGGIEDALHSISEGAQKAPPH